MIKTRRTIDTLLARLDWQESELEKETNRLNELKAQKATIENAHLVLQESVRLTQNQLVFRISKLVSMAMSSVFNDRYQIEIEFEHNRGKVGANIYLKQGDMLIDPLSSSGGGVIDVLDMGLRFSLYMLTTSKPRPLFILDEPLKWLKGGELPLKGAEMLSQLSKKLNIQIIMVSHSPELIQHADKIIEVTKVNGISQVRS